jgi:hypothetical protein
MTVGMTLCHSLRTFGFHGSESVSAARSLAERANVVAEGATKEPA